MTISRRGVFGLAAGATVVDPVELVSDLAAPPRMMAPTNWTAEELALLIADRRPAVVCRVLAEWRSQNLNDFKDNIVKDNLYIGFGNANA